MINTNDILTIEKAKKFLKDNGYYVDTLWHVDDVKAVFDCDDHDADEVLDLILSDCTQTNEAILWVGLEQGLKEKQDEILISLDKRFPTEVEE